MRQVLPAITVAAVLTATVVDVVTAGVRSVTRNNGRIYSLRHVLESVCGCACKHEELTDRTAPPVSD